MEKHDYNLMVVNSSAVPPAQQDNMLFGNLDASPRIEIDFQEGKAMDCKEIGNIT